MKKEILIFGGVVLVVLTAILFFTPRQNRDTTDLVPSAQPSTETLETETTQTPSSPTANLANPASQNCAKVGGQTVIQKRGDGAEYGLCQFEDNMACEEWALFRGNCPIGGVKTIGYDNVQQSYCAWLGGQTLAEPNAQCTLPSGKVCPVDDLYNGTCS